MRLRAIWMINPFDQFLMTVQYDTICDAIRYDTETFNMYR